MARRAKRRTGGDSYEEAKYKIDVKEGNRLAPVLRDLIGTEDPEDLALDILDVLNEGGIVPTVGNYYVFILFFTTWYKCSHIFRKNLFSINRF